MTFVATNPTLRAMQQLSKLLALAVIVPRRTLSLPAQSLVSDIALPGDDDYPLSAQEQSEEAFVRAAFTDGFRLVTERDQLPAAFLWLADGSRDAFRALESGGAGAPSRPGDGVVRPRYGLALKVAAANEETRLAFHDRAAQLLSRIEAERADLGLAGLTIAFDDLTPTFIEGQEELVLIAPVTARHNAQPARERFADVLRIYADPTDLEAASAEVTSDELTLSSTDVGGQPNIASEIVLDGLSIDGLAAAVNAVAGWSAVAIEPHGQQPAGLLPSQIINDLLGAGQAGELKETTLLTRR